MGGGRLYSWELKINLVDQHWQYYDLEDKWFQGKMTKEQFLEKSKEILGEQAGMMGEALFRVFDEDERYFFN